MIKGAFQVVRKSKRELQKTESDPCKVKKKILTLRRVTGVDSGYKINRN